MRRNITFIYLQVIFLLLLNSPITHAGQDGKFFYQPPAPEQLADILFQPRYRSVVIHDVEKKESLPNLFAMMIHFEFDSTSILHESLPLLDSVGRMMKLERTTGRKIIIEGHTDAAGTHTYNQRLSERRAQAIKRYLVSRFLIEPARLVILGRGENDLYDEENPTRSINRRVQFRPLGQVG